MTRSLGPLEMVNCSSCTVQDVTSNRVRPPSVVAVTPGCRFHSSRRIRQHCNHYDLQKKIMKTQTIMDKMPKTTNVGPCCICLIYRARNFYDAGILRNFF